MNASAIDSLRLEPVPHRWHVLQVLRSMRCGHPFIHLCDMSCLMHLEGVPLALHYFDFLARNGYVVPHAKEGLQSHYYKLSPEGIDLYEQGERWWRTLRWQQRVWVMMRG